MFAAFLSAACVGGAAPGAQDADEQHRRQVEARWWTSPSLVGFGDFGDLLASSVWKEPHDTPEKLDLPRRPEFEAMKERLADGIVVSRDLAPQQEIADAYYISDRVQALIKQHVPLPAIRASHFGPGEPAFVAALSPFTLADLGADFVDALSAWHQVPFRAIVLQPSKPGLHGGILGSWDVGQMGVTFARPVRVHAVTAAGRLTGADVISMKVSFDTHCGAPALEVRATALNASWRSATVGWLGKPPLRGRGSVTTRTAGGSGKYDRLVIESIDLDSDKVPDFLTLSGMEPEIASAETRWKLVFGNVAGAWKLLASAQEADCT